jgi:hypothetical protein
MHLSAAGSERHAMARRYLRLLSAALVSIIALQGAAEAQQFILKEQLGQTYGPELVTYQVTFARREQVSVRDVQIRSETELLPAQFLNAELWPGTLDIRRARVAFISDLRAFGEKRFVLEPKKAEQSASDLSVRYLSGAVELATSKFAVRLFLGTQRYDTAVDSRNAPAPIVALRLPNGIWAGSSRFYGNKPVRYCHGKLTEQGPVILEWEGLWEYVDGEALHMRVQLAAGDSRVLVETSYSGQAPNDGWELMLPDAPNLHLPIASEWGNNPWGKGLTPSNQTGETMNVHLAREPQGVITSLVPWADWWDGRTQTAWRFNIPDVGDVLCLESYDAGAWITPDPRGTLVSWGNPYQRSKWVDLVSTANNDLVIRFSNALGARKWLMGSSDGGLGRELDRVKEYVLDWPADPSVTYPHLYISRKELEEFRRSQQGRAARLEQLLAGIPQDASRGGTYALHMALRAYVLTGKRDIAERGRLVERAEALGRMALDRKFDFMRDSAFLVNVFDALAGEDVLTAEPHRVLKARVAWLGYHLADPSTWSSERGYGSGNLDMHVSYIVNLGLVAALFPDHPMARQWGDTAITWLERWLNEYVGPGGEWPENTHYTNVSLSVMLPFLIAASNSGISPLLHSPSLRRLMLWLSYQYAPRDPRYSMQRTLVGYGKGTAGERFALPGIYAKAIAHSDPKLSAELQWLWLASGRSSNIPNRTMAGFEDVVTDPTLFSKAPDWGSTANSHYTIFSNGLANADEHYTFLLTSGLASVSGGETGAIVAMYAYGKPLSALFGNGEWGPWTRHARLQNRVLAARDWDERNASTTGHGEPLVFDRLQGITSQSSFLPRQDYARYRAAITGAVRRNYEVAQNVPVMPTSRPIAKGPVHWTRQLLFVRDNTPAGIHYYLLRDSVTGDQPTEWNMWSMSERLLPAQEAAEAQPFSTPLPGATIIESHELPLTNRYTAIGQYGVDLEYFIAAPTNTPRYTMRWGFTQAPGWNHVPEGFGEYQDLLHLHLPGNGAYYLALFPHTRTKNTPKFNALGAGRIIRVSSVFGTDWGFLNADEAIAEADGVRFEGTAASVQDRTHEIVLALGAAGQVRYKEYELRASQPTSLRFLSDAITLELEDNHPGHTVVVSTGHPLTLRTPIAGVVLETTPAGARIFLPSDVNRVALKRV